MAKNDRLLVDGIIEKEYCDISTTDKASAAFEHFGIKQVQKDFELSNEEIESGIVDGRGDGGIDGFYFYINGHLIDEVEDFHWPKQNAELIVNIITCKSHETFRLATIDALYSTLSEFLDFTKDESQLSGLYNASLKEIRNNLLFSYKKISSRLTSVRFDIYYISKGDTNEIGLEVKSRACHVELLIKELFGCVESSFKFIGSSELIKYYRRLNNYTLDLPFVNSLSRGEQYVILCKLSEYYKFVSDNGVLRRYLFESNVRDFMGFNSVNQDIGNSLKNSGDADFWWLNNGVTIVASGARIIGQIIQISDIQIVNGLQTTESIFRYHQNNDKSDDRCVLVKIIVTDKEAIRDSIIKATNNQTNVEIQSLHATEKIQRDIEDILKSNGLYYERRKNFYQNQGITSTQIISPLYIAACALSLIHGRPDKASVLRGKFMRNKEKYDLIFSDRIPIRLWSIVALVHNNIDIELVRLKGKSGKHEKYFKKFRYIIAFILCAIKFKTFNMSYLLLDGLKNNPPDFHLVKEILIDLETKCNWSDKKKKPTIEMVIEAIKYFGAKYEIIDVEGCEKKYRSNGPFDGIDEIIKRLTPLSDDRIAELKLKIIPIMPSQPWKPGLHKRISKKVNCTVEEYFSFINHCIENGIYNRQKDGVVFDAYGNVVSFDLSRVDPESLKLKEI